MTLDFDTYQSPFTWRYGSPGMRAIWSEVNKRRMWRRLWVALAEAQVAFGLVQGGVSRRQVCVCGIYGAAAHEYRKERGMGAGFRKEGPAAIGPAPSKSGPL